MYWIIGVLFQCATLLFLVEKPPVESVLIAWLIASKKLIPATDKSMVSAKVYPTYINHKRFAVSVILGCNLSLLGPGASAANNCIPPIPKRGKMAIANTIIPIPPIQCVVLRQNKIPFGTDSISLRMVDPVVV